MWKLWSEGREEGEREEEKVEHFSEESVMEWQKTQLLLEKRGRNDESGLEPYLLCVCVDVERKLGWTAVRELVSRDVWQTQLPSMAPQLPLRLLLYWGNSPAFVHVYVTVRVLWLSDFHRLCMYSVDLPRNGGAELALRAANSCQLQEWKQNSVVQSHKSDVKLKIKTD